MFSSILKGSTILSTGIPDVASSKARPTFSWFLLILANALWASSYVVAKFALHDISVIMLNTLRMSIAACVLLPWLVVKWKYLRLTWHDLPQLALLSIAGFVFNKLFEYGGLSLTTASDVALLITSETIFTVALSWLMLRERFKPITIGAIVCGFVGVYLIIERSIVPNLPSGGGIFRILGDLLVIFGLVFEAFFTVRGKALLVKHSPLLVIAAAIVGSTVFWIPMGAWEVLTRGWPVFGIATGLSIGWMALVMTVISYFAWFRGLAKVDASTASSTLFLQPLLGTVLAVVLLHDSLTPYTIVGGLLIVVSVYVVSKQ